MKATASLVYRALVIAGCVFAGWRSVHFAKTDWAAGQNTIVALERAVQYSPEDPRLLARLAIAQSDAGGQSPGSDDQLRRVSLLDPFNSDVLMTLGLREEFEGNKAAAKRELTRATEIDHQFKPAWTLANFYDRMGEPDRALPMIERILNLDPLGFNPAPVFELCWRATGDKPEAVLSMVPNKDSWPVQYVAFLMATQRTDATVQAWPKALAVLDPQNAGDLGTLTALVDFFAGAGHLSDAVTVWNRLVKRGFIHSARLDPTKGESVADPAFQFPATGRGFAWLLNETPGVSTSVVGGSLHLEISGDEPESFQVLSVRAPLMPNRTYRLNWKSDASTLRDARDPGFFFRITQGNVTKDCAPMLASDSCDFPSAAGVPFVPASLALIYARAQGTTRAAGTLVLSAVHLEFMP